MVTMRRGPNWRIAVYGREHGVAHFHIEGSGFRCSVAISNLQVIVGAVPLTVRREALAWADEHRAELLAKWRELNP